MSIKRKVVEYLEGCGGLRATLLARARALVVDAVTLARLPLPWEHRESVCHDLIMEPTNICNAKCVFCAYQFQDGFRRTRGVMSRALFERVAEEFKALGGRVVTYSPLLGEPLVDPDFVPRMGYLKDMGFAVCTNTNGTLLLRHDLEALVRLKPAHFVLSLGPLEKGSYELVYRNALYDELLRGVEELLTVRNRLRSTMVVHVAFRSYMKARDTLSLPDFRNRVLPLLTARERELVECKLQYDTWGGGGGGGGGGGKSGKNT